MKNLILNFLATRLGAALAPVIMTTLAGLVAAVAAKIPWLAPYATLENALMLVSILIAIGMTWVNYATTSRAFKYAEPVQKFLATLADKLGVKPPVIDGVIAGQTAGIAEELHGKITEPGGAYKVAEDIRRSELGLKPHGREGLRGRRGHVVFHLLVGMALFSLCMLMACAVRVGPQKAGPAIIRVPKAIQFPDVTETIDLLPRNLSGPWLQEESEIHTAEYLRPAWQRMLISLRPWGELGNSHGRARLDNERVSSSQLIPDSYAIGIGGGLELP